MSEAFLGISHDTCPGNFINKYLTIWLLYATLSHFQISSKNKLSSTFSTTLYLCMWTNILQLLHNSLPKFTCFLWSFDKNSVYCDSLTKFTFFFFNFLKLRKLTFVLRSFDCTFSRSFNCIHVFWRNFHFFTILWQNWFFFFSWSYI